MSANLIPGIRRLYHGTGSGSVWFRRAILVLDAVTIVTFLIFTFFEINRYTEIIDIGLAIILTIELLMRLAISPKKWAFMLEMTTLADLVVIISLFAVAANSGLGFLRIFRAMRLLRSYHMLGKLREEYRWVRQNEDIIFAVLNLAVFIFICTAFVYVGQRDINSQITDYLDALYFTIATLTTTGFGDITLVGSHGKLLAVLIMIFGISLFLRLVQTVFRPSRVRHKCPQCGLVRHDADAVHCKHCGLVLNIPNEGD